MIRKAIPLILAAAVLLTAAMGTVSAEYQEQPNNYSSSLVTHNGSYVYDWQLANMVDMWIADQGFANMVFIGTQCYSGGMMDEMADRLQGDGDVAMASSARHDETANACPDNPTSPANNDFWHDEAGFDQAESAWAKEMGEEMARTGDDAQTIEDMAENAADQNPAKDDGLFEDTFGEQYTENPQFRELGNGGDVKLGKKTDGTEAASKHAILFSGHTEGRHWNNVDRAHDALKGHGFTEGDIHVLAGGGKNDPDAPGYVDGPGTKQALFDAIEDLRDEMNENEQFVLWTDDHGNRERTETALNKAINDSVKQTIPPRETAASPDSAAWDLDESFLDDIRAEPDNTPYVSIVIEPEDFDAFPEAALDYRIILNDEPLLLDDVEPIEALDADPDLDGYELTYPVENEDLLRPENTIEGEWTGSESAFRPFTIDTLIISTGRIDEVVPTGTPRATIVDITPDPAAVGQPVTFSVDEDAAIGDVPVTLDISYGWEFGDGATGTGETATHTYSEPGTFDVTLTVRPPGSGPDLSRPFDAEPGTPEFTDEWIRRGGTLRDTVQITSEDILGDDLFTSLNQSVEQYNDNVDRLPDIIRNVVANERINADIRLSDGGTLEIGIQTRNGRVTEFQRGHLDNPTLTGSTSEGTAREIAASGDPATTALNAVQSGEIQYSGVGATNSIKTEATKIAIKVYFVIRDLIG